ncbi:MAG TPA: hypothetical protein VGJ63_03925 [Micromonosporaceae bacterium]
MDLRDAGIRTPEPGPRTEPSGWATARRGVRLAGWLAAGWLVPIIAYAVGVAWVLPPLLLFGTAGLLRAGRTLLDRFVLASALLVGAGCAAGLAWSVWPWGLHPVPVAGTALTGLVAIAVATGRRPSLPRPMPFDGVAVGTAIAVTAVLALPYLRGGLAGRLAYAIVGEDNARHLGAYEAIRASGGYLFAVPGHGGPAAPDMMIYYPQGFHLLAGTLDGFVRSSTAPVFGPSALDHYLGWLMAAFALLVLCTVWAAAHLGGRQLDLPRRVAVAGFVAAAFLGSELARLVVYGYPGQTLGTALCVVLAAVVCRPLTRARGQLALVACLLIGIAFTYWFLLPVAGVLALVWLVRDRRAVRRHLAPFAVAAVATAAVAAVPPLLSVRGAGITGEHVTVGGSIWARYDALVALAALIGAGLVTRGGRRSSVWRGYAAVLAATVTFAGGIAAYSLGHGTEPRYYYGKALQLVLVVLVIGVGAVALLLPAPWRLEGPNTRLPAALLLAVAAAGASGVFFGQGMYQQPFNGRSTTWAAAWVRGQLDRASEGRLVARAYAAYPPLPGTVTALVADDPGASYRGTLFLATLQGTVRDSAPAFYRLPFHEPARTEWLLRRVPGRVRLVTEDAAAAAAVDTALAHHPEWRIRVSVVLLPAG